MDAPTPNADIVVDINGTEKTLNIDAGRRAFVRGLGLAAGAGVLGAAATIGGALPVRAQGGGLSDTDILNFALNLEYLEAEFYLQAAFGRGLRTSDTTGRGPRGDVQGGTKVGFDTGAIRAYAREIADDEEKHVRFLRRALGNEAVARPSININRAFTLAARAAGLVGNSDTFNAYANEVNFLLAAYIFEDVGVTAYKGAAPLISDPAILSAAAGLLGTEAYHAGLIRTLAFQLGLFDQTRAISKLRDAVDGPAATDQPIGRPGESNIVLNDQNALVFGRTPAQVLAIVYLGGDKKGGFFPDGVNS